MEVLHRAVHTVCRIAAACVLSLAVVTIAATPSSAQTEGDREEYRLHVVQAGDTLLALAAEAGITVAELRELNDLGADENVIFIGQELRLPVPVPAPCSIRHVVQSGETLWGIAELYETTVEELMSLNVLEDRRLVAEGLELCVADAVPTAEQPGQIADIQWGVRPAEDFWYTVNQGDTLALIASRYGLTVTQLRQANDLLENAEVTPQQLLLVPGSGTEGPSISRPWFARYFEGPDLEGEPVVERYEENIAYFWLGGSPHADVPADSFSAEWHGEFQFAQGSYRFIGVADHGLRIHVGGRLLLDSWEPDSDSHFHADLEMEGGITSVRVEYREVTGPALVFVTWHAAAADIPE